MSNSVFSCHIKLNLVIKIKIIFLIISQIIPYLVVNLIETFEMYMKHVILISLFKRRTKI